MKIHLLSFSIKVKIEYCTTDRAIVLNNLVFSKRVEIEGIIDLIFSTSLNRYLGKHIAKTQMKYHIRRDVTRVCTVCY